MVPDINPPGGRTIGLLKYLYRTSDIEAHVDPHIVAAYDPFVVDPGRDPSATFSELAADLDQWVDALKDKAPVQARLALLGAHRGHRPHPQRQGLGHRRPPHRQRHRHCSRGR
ncbi:hypothetical protein OH809_20300 [Streptomyces sp. NBC_00873]|nr:hypothetical protein OH809_20300 [Streptomyces sp. NBC_00873]WTA45191.1 hypothetical protein OH821_23400 [Streptomyces sp. NBC_00842]